jgi:hypothetical protein
MTSNNTKIIDLFDKMKTATGLGMDEVAMYYQKQIDDLLDSARSTAINNEPSTSSSSVSSSSSSVTADLKKRSINHDQTDHTDHTINHTPIPASSASSASSPSSASSASSPSFASTSSFASASSSAFASSVSITSKKRSNDQTSKLNHSPIQASTSPSSVLHLQNKKPRTEDLNNNASLLLYQRQEIDPIIQTRNDNNNKLSFHDASHASLGVTDPESTSKVTKYFDDKSKYIQ